MLPAICRSKLFRPLSQVSTFRCDDLIIFLFRYFDPSLSVEIRTKVFDPIRVGQGRFVTSNLGDKVFSSFQRQ